jgi:hypothetical protein
MLEHEASSNAVVSSEASGASEASALSRCWRASSPSPSKRSSWAAESLGHRHFQISHHIEKGVPTQAAAAFALRRFNKPEAEAILQHQKRITRSNVRRSAAALGESMHEH